MAAAASALPKIDKSKLSFDAKYLDDIPVLVWPKATFVPMAHCHVCDTPAKDGELEEIAARGQHPTPVVRYCKTSDACAKAAKASLAVWMADEHKGISYHGHAMKDCKLNVPRSSGVVESGWRAVEFRLSVTQYAADQRTKLTTNTVGLYCESDEFTKAVPMWIVFKHNVALKPVDIMPKWPEYFPPDVARKCAAEIDAAYASVHHKT